MSSDARNLKLRESPALLGILEPGDRIVASVVASEGLRLLVSAVVSVLLVLAFVLVVVFTGAVIVVVPLLLAFIIVNLGVQSRQKIYFVGITDRLFACHVLPRFGGGLTRLLFTAPLSQVRVTVGGQNLFGRPVLYSGPGPDEEALELFVANRSAADLAEVLAALRAGGAGVEGPPQASDAADPADGPAGESAAADSGHGAREEAPAPGSAGVSGEETPAAEPADGPAEGPAGTGSANST